MPRRSRSKEPRKSPSADEVSAALRGVGLRRTAPRAAVLRFLATASSPLSHGEIAEAVGGTFDRVTVYRNLHDLVGAGLVRRTDLGDHVWRYELRRDGGAGAFAGEHANEHPHFLCVSCGTVSCLTGVEATFVRSGSGKVPRAVGRRAVEVQIKGRCDACAR